MSNVGEDLDRTLHGRPKYVGFGSIDAYPQIATVAFDRHSAGPSRNKAVASAAT